MTNKLLDGDFVIGPRGVLETVEGSEELLQRARIRLQARRGRFALDPVLGSDLYQVDLSQAAPDGLEARIREALAPLPQVRLTATSQRTDPDSGRIWIQAELELRG